MIDLTQDRYEKVGQSYVPKIIPISDVPNWTACIVII